MSREEYYTTRCERTGRAIETDGGQLLSPDDETAEDLRAAIAALEAVDWCDVPNVSAPTAAVFTAMCRRGLEGGGK